MAYPLEERSIASRAYRAALEDLDYEISKKQRLIAELQEAANLHYALNQRGQAAECQRQIRDAECRISVFELRRFEIDDREQDFKMGQIGDDEFVF